MYIWCEANNLKIDTSPRKGNAQLRLITTVNVDMIYYPMPFFMNLVSYIWYGGTVKTIASQVVNVPGARNIYQF